jgi:NitT/TauT family transport system substrate-binding protein
MVRADPQSHLDVVCKAFNWKRDQAQGELAKVHLANFAENMAFFAGTIDAAGSYNYIYESSVMAYGPEIVRSPFNSEKFLNLKPLKALEAEGKFKGQKADIKPIRSAEGAAVEEPLLSRDIRFLFQPNSSKLNMEDKKNQDDLAFMARMLQVSPGSTLLLRGHVDNAKVADFQKQGGPELVMRMALKAKQLSKERCQGVLNALVERQRVDPARVEIVGMGWDEPLGADMDQNRRVEVQWITLE